MENRQMNSDYVVQKGKKKKRLFLGQGKADGHVKRIAVLGGPQGNVGRDFRRSGGGMEKEGKNTSCCGGWITFVVCHLLVGTDGEFEKRMGCHD